MLIEVRDQTTLIIKPESTAELVFLQKFEGALAVKECPKPFAPNIEVLKLEEKK